MGKLPHDGHCHGLAVAQCALWPQVPGLQLSRSAWPTPMRRFSRLAHTGDPPTSWVAATATNGAAGITVVWSSSLKWHTEPLFTARGERKLPKARVAFTGLSVTPKRADMDSDFRAKVEAVPGAVFRRRCRSRPMD
jgi:hypothetical protein